MPEESLPVDIISADQFAKVTAGMKTGKKENPKPLVEKVAEAKPVDDAVGKISEKPPVVTDTSPPPQPKPAEKPVEKKPDPPKPVAEAKPKEEPKPIEKKPDPPKVDPIAEALKKEEKKPPPKPQAQAAPPQPPKPKKERTFDQSKIAALLDKRDPTRQAITGEALNSNAALGTSHRQCGRQFATWRARRSRRRSSAAGRSPMAASRARTRGRRSTSSLKRGRHAGSRRSGPDAEAVDRVIMRAVGERLARDHQCQPYTFCRRAFFDEWKYFAPVFDREA